MPRGWYVSAPTHPALVDGVSSMPTPGEDGYGPDSLLSQVGALSSEVGAGAGPDGVASPIGGKSGGGANAGELTPDHTYNGIVSILVAILFIWLALKTRLGYVVLYYMVVLLLLYFIISNAAWVAAALQPLDDATAGIGTGT